MYSFGFIGCGNMGGTLASAVFVNCRDIAVSDKNEGLCAEFAGKHNASATTNTDIASHSRFIVLGVKPQVLPFVLDEIKGILSARTDRFTVISMAAGIEIKRIAELIGKDVPIIRIMPNTPAAVGEGMILYAANGLVSAEELSAFREGFSAAGELEELPESLIDAGSAISGCGPAFIYMFIEALADGGVKCGLPRKTALRLAAKTVSGSGKMVLETKCHPGELKDAVCSPGGSTIEGVRALEKSAFRGAAIDAVTAAFIRTKELGK